MPYIGEDRISITKAIDLMWSTCSVKNPGDLNFLITTVLERYRGHKKRYALFNEIVGVLECIKQEYYRRMVAPYEEEKREENGDVYDI